MQESIHIFLKIPCSFATSRLLANVAAEGSLRLLGAQEISLREQRRLKLQSASRSLLHRTSFPAEFHFMIHQRCVRHRGYPPCVRRLFQGSRSKPESESRALPDVISRPRISLGSVAMLTLAQAESIGVDTILEDVCVLSKEARTAKQKLWKQKSLWHRGDARRRKCWSDMQ